MGSGQTAIATIKAGRHYVGYEINKEYAESARRRIKEVLVDLRSPSILDYGEENNGEKAI